jgi:hypothetical protein
MEVCFLNRILALLILLILLQIPAIFIQLETEQSENSEPKEPEMNTIQDEPESNPQAEEENGLTNYQNLQLFNLTVDLVEGNEHGGSWLDSFEDFSGIEWNLSENLNISYGDARIITPFQPKVDSKTVAIWHLDEGTGNKAYDSTSNNNHGTINGATWTNGLYGKALSFDGTNDYIKVPNSKSLQLTTEFTIFSVFYVTPGTNYNIYDYRHILAKGAVYVTLYADYAVGLSNTYGLSQFESQKTGSNPTYIRGGTSPTQGEWHSIVTTFNKGNINFYVDGTLVKTTSISQTTLRVSNQPLYIGARYDSPVKGPWNGKIDEVWLSSSADGPINNIAYLTSKRIDLPSGKQWDTISIDKTQPENTFLNVTILDASTNLTIPGTPKYIDEGEFDISFIDPAKYPFIRLNATLTGNNWGLTPTLHYWGVSWNATNAWRDSFFVKDKVYNSNGTVSIDGFSTSINQFAGYGYLESNPISIPPDHHFDTMLINTTEPLGTDINITILEASNNTPLAGFIDIAGSGIDMSSIDTALYPKIKLNAIFNPSGNLTFSLFDWSVNWTENVQKPQPPGNGSPFIDIDPDTLNLKSEGRWITCYIEPQDGSNPADINISTILLNGTVPAELHPATVSDYDNDSLPDLMVKFNRSDVQKLVSVGSEVELFVEGYYKDGTFFKGSDIIRVINPPDDKHDNGKGKDKDKKDKKNKNNKK